MMRSASRSDRRAAERGAALIVAVVVIVIVAGTSATFLTLGMGRFERAKADREAVQANLYAEGAAALRVHAINSGGVPAADMAANTVPPATFTWPHGSATVTVDSSRSGANPNVVMVESTATVGGRSTAIEVMLTRRRKPLFGFGVGANSDVQMQHGVLLDSYNSLDGNYTTTQGEDGDLGSQTGTVQLQNVTIKGDVSIGGTLQESGSTITGSIITDDPPVFPLVDAEVDSVISAAQSSNNNAALATLVAASGGDWELSGSPPELKSKHDGSTLVVPPGTYNLKGIQMQHDSTIRFGGPGDVVLAVAGNIQFQHGGGILIDPGANVRTYVRGGNVQVQHHVTVNPGDALLQASQFQVYGHSSSSLQLQHHGAIFGAFYFPGSDVQIQHDVELFGAVISKKIQVQHGAKIHYDAGLAQIGTPGSFGVSGFRKLAHD